MTDYFALLDQPRRPWLNPDELKQAFHAKSRELHPDAQSETSSAVDTRFAQLNEAHQVLQDPKRRIQHLLTLEGRAPARATSVPDDIADLFSVVADAIQQADAVARKLEASGNPLTRSLLKPQVLAAQTQIADALRRLEELNANAVVQAQRLSFDRLFEENDWSELHRLYVRFSYLGRWMAELQEKQAQLL